MILFQIRDREAKKGEVHYQGRPCRKCGETLRYICSSNCVACAVSRSQRRHETIRKLMKRAKP